MAIRFIIERNDSRTFYELTYRAHIFGRSTKADVCIDDQLISGKHLKITLDKNIELTVTDLDSTNGTFINGSKIVSQKFFIGDTIVIGKTSIRLDTKALAPKEYKSLFNSERTSIRFIDSGMKTDSIQKEIYDISRSKSSKITEEAEEISFNIDSIPAFSPESLEESQSPPLKEEEKFDIIQDNDKSEFAFNHSFPKEVKNKSQDRTTFQEKLENDFKSSGTTEHIKLEASTKQARRQAKVPLKRLHVREAPTKEKSLLKRFLSFLFSKSS